MDLLLKERKNYLNKKNITILDKSPYQEFIIKCDGKAINQNRDYFLRMRKKNKFMFTYNPENSKKFTKPHIKFENTTGDINKRKI
jgi:hypothetical protein